MRRRFLLAAATAILCLPLSARAAEIRMNEIDYFAKVAEEFLYGYLALSPSSATFSGYHEHRDPATGKLVSLDEQLDDVSAAGIERQRNGRRRSRFRQTCWNARRYSR